MPAIAWSADGEGNFDTTCGGLFILLDGDPSDNRMGFCCYCGKPLAVVCHAPAALLSTRIRGVSPFAGYRVTGFTNDEEEGVGLASRARWLLEDELKVLGVDFVRGDMWKPYTVVDRNLYTGQNPASAEALAAELLKVL